MSDTPVIEYEGESIAEIMWHEAGVALKTTEGEILMTDELGRVECGMAVTRVMDLYLLYNTWVTARDARFGGA